RAGHPGPVGVPRGRAAPHPRRELAFRWMRGGGHATPPAPTLVTAGRRGARGPTVERTAVSVASPTSQQTGATAQLVGFVCRPDRRAEPAARAALRGLVADTVGVAVAGLATPAALLVRDWVEDQTPPGALRAAGTAAVWGTGDRFGPADAALVNGTAAPALDADDAAPSM